MQTLFSLSIFFSEGIIEGYLSDYLDKIKMCFQIKPLVSTHISIDFAQSIEGKISTGGKFFRMHPCTFSCPSLLPGLGIVYVLFK